MTCKSCKRKFKEQRDLSNHAPHCVDTKMTALAAYHASSHYLANKETVAAALAQMKPLISAEVGVLFAKKLQGLVSLGLPPPNKEDEAEALVDTEAAIAFKALVAFHKALREDEDAKAAAGGEDEAAAAAAAAADAADKPGAKRRHQYTIKEKASAVEALMTAEKMSQVARGNFSPLQYVARELDINESTLSNWNSDAERGRILVMRKQRGLSSMVKVGSGRHPFFPGAEAAAKAWVQELRRKGAPVTLAFFIAYFRQKSLEENPALYEKMRFSPMYVYRVLRRSGLSMRRVTNLKRHDLREGREVMSQFLRQFICLLRQDQDEHLGRVVVTGADVDFVRGKTDAELRAYVLQGAGPSRPTEEEAAAVEATRVAGCRNAGNPWHSCSPTFCSSPPLPPPPQRVDDVAMEEAGADDDVVMMD